MEILLPISLGFVINLLTFIISKYFKQNTGRSLLFCLTAFLVVLLGSFIIGSWLGMGIGVISSGMLFFVILAGFVIRFLLLKGNFVS